MKSLLLSLLLLSLLLTSCGYSTPTKAVQTVSDVFGGEVSYKMGVTLGTEASQKNMAGPYAELEIKNSPLTAKFQQLDLPASYAAYLFFSALTEAEHRSYASIRVTIVGENSTNTSSFSTFDLALVRQAAPQMAQVVDAIHTQQYARLDASASPEAFSDTVRQQMKALFVDADVKSGAARAYHPYGFRLRQDTVAGRPVLLLYTFGQLERAKSSAGFCIITEPGVPVTEKYLFGFEVY